MKYLETKKAWLCLPVYLLGGLALGLVDPQLGRWVQQLGARPGLATAASVNLLLPILAISLGMACPRLTTAWLGAVLMTGGLVLGLALVYPPAPLWDVTRLLGSVRPLVVLACLGYGVLGTLTVVATRYLAKERCGSRAPQG
jgi:hypothetical protein